MDWGLLILLLFLHVGAAVLQARWVAWGREKTCLQDRCLIPVILSLLVLALTAIGLWRAKGWDALGWNILLHFGALPLAGAVILGTLAGLWLHRKNSKTEEKQ